MLGSGVRNLKSKIKPDDFISVLEQKLNYKLNIGSLVMDFWLIALTYSHRGDTQERCPVPSDHAALCVLLLY